ncbi:MAG TPA: trehalase-like domain-containing protein, partial [Polyangiaceae bacterium]|nr:trehalase-like domain-containing protein [Polyangiaceae bacterium]
MSQAPPISVIPDTQDLVRAGAAALQIPALDHGAIGNGRVLGLVSPTSALEWLCMPRFDSPSVFARLLDRKKGGSFRLLAGDREVRGELRYLTNTNVLSTRFQADGAAWEVIDFAPRIPEGLSVRVPLEVVRIVRPLAGHAKLRVDFDPRPDYGRAKVELRETTDGIEVLGGQSPLNLATNVPCPYVLAKREFVLNKPLYFVLTYGRREGVATMDRVFQELDSTVAGWRAWAKTCALPNFAPAHVLRSALCLKLHAYHDTGAIVAAATTSIPEAMGTPRAWDYRYCWLRDAAFVVE